MAASRPRGLKSLPILATSAPLVVTTTLAEQDLSDHLGNAWVGLSLAATCKWHRVCGLSSFAIQLCEDIVLAWIEKAKTILAPHLSGETYQSWSQNPRIYRFTPAPTNGDVTSNTTDEEGSDPTGRGGPCRPATKDHKKWSTSGNYRGVLASALLLIFER